ncbi:MAG: methylenetetrahydrofolate reductase [Bacteroidaceae bacterium]|nr:methylenetetrahydrofolate reductase [Bacteroidaceae bacterium]
MVQKSIAELLTETQETLFSFEVLPPRKGKSIQQIYDTIEQLLPYSPAFIEVTTHRSEYNYREMPDGNYRRVEERLRPGTVAVAADIRQKYGIPVVPHVICSGNSQIDSENELIDLSFLGIYDLVVLRGDKSKHDARFIPHPHGLKYASELCEQINRFNEGTLVYGDHHDMISERRFSYGVAGYPEKHEEAMSMQSDLDALKLKVDMGAGYIVTQMFYDTRRYRDFCDRCIGAGINVPIVPGLKPLTSLNHCTMLPRTFHIDFPDELVAMLQRCTTSEDVRAVGIEWGIRQAEELRAMHAPCLHFYTMNAAPSIVAIMNAL